MNPYSELVSAYRRSTGMGKSHSWRTEFESHLLAPSIDNHLSAIEVELKEKTPDYLSILYWELNMARKINQYCDSTKVKDDIGAEYWLHMFASHTPNVGDYEKLQQAYSGFSHLTDLGKKLDEKGVPTQGRLYWSPETNQVEEIK